jgi:endonuclease III
MGTELIMGMEEVINYLKELEAKNKKLEEENEDNLASLNFYTEQCAELKDERKKLKEERDFFNQEFHKTLQCQADEAEEYEKYIKELKEQMEAFESLTGIGRDVVCRHNDPDDDDYYTYKTYEEYEEEIGERDDSEEEITEPESDKP